MFGKCKIDNEKDKMIKDLSESLNIANAKIAELEKELTNDNEQLFKSFRGELEKVKQKIVDEYREKEVALINKIAKCNNDYTKLSELYHKEITKGERLVG